jgi:fumarate reductase flavoprotein subunit
MSLRPATEAHFGIETDVAVIGAGCAGLIAALAAREFGAEVAVFERDPLPRGSTALSSGLIPAAGTRLQKEAGIADSPERHADDIRNKAHNEVDEVVVRAVTTAVGSTIDWLMERHAVPFVLDKNFLYPGFSAPRMHGTPNRRGEELMDHLYRAAIEASVDVLTEARAECLYHDAGCVRGLRIARPDGSGEDVACKALVLACCGFGGNRAMVRQYIPVIAEAPFLGHAGNEGHGILWGEALGGELRQMGAFQGHGSVAIPHNMGISWAALTSGGIQVNVLGERFANEHRGYSEQAVDVLRQPGGFAFDIYDERCHQVTLGWGHYRDAVAAGVLRSGATATALAATLGLPLGALERTLASVASFAAGGTDPFGRDFTTQPALKPPYYAVKVTGGLYHTQGGLAVDGEGRVKRRAGGVLPNLFAAGGAACGVSGSADWGYLAGNGLLTAVALGRLAGTAAARLARSEASDSR